MLSDDLWLVQRALEAAAHDGKPLAPVDAEMLAGILRMAALDAQAIEDIPMALGGRPVRPAPDLEAATRVFSALCVTPAPAGSAQIIPFPRVGRYACW